ncbi:GNA1162 family protein [Tepidimonas sp.]|uniref:GNA1162 family protein n=1 Tax=Tepidimonas sp. TaxID=2002775 RepID=UPI002FE06AE5
MKSHDRWLGVMALAMTLGALPLGAQAQNHGGGLGHPNRLAVATPEYAVEKPQSVVVLPPVNHAKDLRASESVYPHVYVALASKGYEVPAPTVVQEVLRDNGVTDWGLVQEIPVEKLAEVFGTDAALFVDIDDYGTHYQLVRTVARVHLRGRLVSLKTGRLLWEGKAKWEDVDQDTSSVAALLINALVSQVVRDSSNFAYRVAGSAASHLIWSQKLPAGALCPDVGKDGTDCYRPLQ